MNNIKKEEISRAIDWIMKNGGRREKEILKGLFTVERATWNAEHKVIEFLNAEADPDGYRSGFQFDLVTNSICG